MCTFKKARTNTAQNPNFEDDVQVVPIAILQILTGKSFINVPKVICLTEKKNSIRFDGSQLNEQRNLLRK